MQNEIEESMGIDDVQFNAYFSIKAFSSMLPAFVIALVMHRVPLRIFLNLSALICTIGQGFFAAGISRGDH